MLKYYSNEISKDIFMIKNKKTLIASLSVFIAVEAILGYLLQTANGELIPYFCFSSVVLACLFCTAFAEKSKAYLLTQLALVCTVCADFFLLITPVREQFIAMIFFSITQLAYFIRLYVYDENKTRKVWHISIRAFLSLLAITMTLVVLGESADAVAIISMFYYANLIANIIFAFAQFRQNQIFAIGLLLFAMCDALIGFAFLDEYMAISPDSVIYKIIHPGFDLAWAFYLPSQVLLSISLLPKRWKSKKPSHT